MRLLYTISILAYRLAIGIASLFNTKARKWIEGRKGIFEKLEKDIDPSAALAWFHCASLGEFEQGRPVIEAFRKKHPHYKILLTFFSPSGYEIRKSYRGADHVYYLPLDTRANAERFISITQPKIVLFVKYEFWFNYLDILHKKNIPFYLISATFRSDQHFFKSYGAWFRKALNNYAHIFVQNETSKQLLSNAGVQRVTVSGDTRFDRVAEIVSNAKDLPIAGAFANNTQVMVAGSTWEEDEKFLIELIKHHRELKLIIAPHEIGGTRIGSLVSSLEKITTVIRFSQANERNVINSQVLIIDNIGMLSSLYRYGKIAYIGGGFGKGIHNILEAAAYGMPVIFGPNYEKFLEAKTLVKLQGAFSISSYDELNKCVHELLNDQMKLAFASKISGDYVRENTGATSVILNALMIEQSI
jgi:3-deoxy-D-manno-octulosonic-acid transferase